MVSMNVPLLYHWSDFIVIYTQYLFVMLNVRLKNYSKCIVKLRNLQKKKEEVPIFREAVNYLVSRENCLT